MKNIFGVKSTTPANKKLKNGYTIYDWVMRQRCFPGFWLRTLLGDAPVSAEEIEYLRSKDCKIGLVMRDLTEIKLSSGSGTADAIRAVAAAKDLGVPANNGIAIFVEIDSDWSINHNWMLSFAETVVNNGYIPGFIGNTDSSMNFNFGRQCSHFVNATPDVDHYGAVYCATEPKLSDMPAEWSPYCPSALEPEDMSLWVCGKTNFGALEVEDVYARDNTVLNCMW